MNVQSVLTRTLQLKGLISENTAKSSRWTEEHAKAAEQLIKQLFGSDKKMEEVFGNGTEIDINKIHEKITSDPYWKQAIAESKLANQTKGSEPMQASTMATESIPHQSLDSEKPTIISANSTSATDPVPAHAPAAESNQSAGAENRNENEVGVKATMKESSSVKQSR
jgi:hypothetical protein